MTTYNRLVGEILLVFQGEKKRLDFCWCHGSDCHRSESRHDVIVEVTPVLINVLLRDALASESFHPYVRTAVVCPKWLRKHPEGEGTTRWGDGFP